MFRLKPRIEIPGYKIIVPTELKNMFVLAYFLPRARALGYKIHRSYGTEKPKLYWLFPSYFLPRD